jgi:ABC-type transporter lipoprotein component MlaA
MAEKRSPRELNNPAIAEKTKTPQLPTVGPSKLTDKLQQTANSVESLLKLANACIRLVRLALDAIEQIKEIIT